MASPASKKIVNSTNNITKAKSLNTKVFFYNLIKKNWILYFKFILAWCNQSQRSWKIDLKLD
jgi:hypothetical protein